MTKQVIVVTKLRSLDLREPSRHIHRETLKRVLAFLKRLPVKVRAVDRNHLSKSLQADLAITVGGDGTLLAASHFIRDTPLLGINSAPQTSTGFFCKGNPRNFPALINAILKGEQKPKTLFRLQVTIQGKRFPFPALNDVLFASKLQGETSRYRIQAEGGSEDQKSSGVWVASGAGSTAAIYSAGGKKDSLFTRRIQYKVREPFCFSKHRYLLLGGFLGLKKKLVIISHMKQGMIFVDGGRMIGRVPEEAKVTIQGGHFPLKIFL